MKIAVLGAGVTGVTTAYSLASQGYAVTVFDRQPASAEETSFANGGQISVSQPFPWSSPDLPRKLIRWLGHDAAPLVFKMQADPYQWAWGVRYLLNCRTSLFFKNAEKIVELAKYSQLALNDLISAENLKYDREQRGILKLFETDREAEDALARQKWLRDHGVEQEFLSREGCMDIEPSLHNTASNFIGGTYSKGDESGNARAFTKALESILKEKGVQFHYSATINGFDTTATTIDAMIVNDQTERFDAFVLCSGAFSRPIAQKAGVNLPIYPVKGYSVSIPVKGVNTAPMTSITDETRHIVISRLGDTLRAAGTAEINGYQTDPNSVREDMVLKSVMDLFPECGDPAKATRWAGLRPMTTDSVPLVGPTKIKNFYTNTGHGPLGWTLACGSADLIAKHIAGKTTKLDILGYSVDRF
ncbi:D-amino acid dehydrogenase [Sneathiella aquimaris]|uniref:D-amino acid dehydrogenase n=1 Tax=Sneathiella aquimaris TaxID=2599305 RepID=UPI00146D0AC9|nr:D-amino acid dehydrogenase [Sneathiella aquimaris]